MGDFFSSRQTVLITGGSRGIGLKLAEALVGTHRVLLHGRRPEALAEASLALGGVEYFAADLENGEARRELCDWVKSVAPDLSVLVNNAGARRLCPPDDAGLWAHAGADLRLNLQAPIDLCSQLLPVLRGQASSMVVNVTTGLVHAPKAAQPLYCAAKAALHSYTQSLRWQLRGSCVRVVEVMPPLVDTGFHPEGVPGTIAAMSASAVASACLRGIARGSTEIRIGKSRVAPWLALLAPGRLMHLVNRSTAASAAERSNLRTDNR